MALHAGAKPILTYIRDDKREAPARGPNLAALRLQMPRMAALRLAAFPRGRTNLRPHTVKQNGNTESGQRNREQGRAGVDHWTRLKRLAEQTLGVHEVARLKRQRLGDDFKMAQATETVLQNLHLTYGTKAGRFAKARGTSLKQQEQLKAQREAAAIKLFQELPPSVLHRLGGWRPEVFDALPAHKIHAFICSWCQKWEAGTLNNARLAWCRLRLWLSKHEQDAAVEVPCVADLADYFHWVHHESVERAKKAYAKKCERATRAGKPQPAMKQDGTRAAKGQWDGLDFLARNLNMALPTNLTRHMLPGRTGVTHGRPRKSSPPLPIKVLVELERFITRKDCPLVARNIGGAILFLAYGCHRWKQSGSVQFYGYVDGCLCGQVDVDKGSRKEPRPFFLPIQGLVSGTAWLRVLLETLPTDGGYIFSDFEGKVSSPAAQFLPAPLPQAKVDDTIRQVISMACPWLTQQELADITRHGPRHVLPTASAARGKPFEHQVEIGRWSGCSVYRQGLLAPEALRTKHALHIMTMPATYSVEAATKNAIRIMKDEMQAIRSYVASMGSNLPASGGWERLPR